MKIKLKAILIPLIIVVLGISGYLLFSKSDSSEAASKKDPQNVDYEKLDDVIFKVKTKEAFVGDLIKTTNSNGAARAAQEIKVSSNISGYIEEINVHEGKKVRKGDTLIELEDEQYRLELKEAQDQLIEARVEYGLLTKESPIDTTAKEKAVRLEEQIDKLENRYEKGMIDDKEYFAQKDELELKLIFTGAKREELIRSKSGYNRAKHARERAKMNLDRTNITAPFDGVVGDFNLSVGQRINTGDELFKLLDLSKILIDVGVLESEIPNIEKGNYAEIKFNALPGEEFDGKVKYISPYIDPESKTCRVTVSMDNPNTKIKPGMFARVEIEDAVLENRLLVPKDALLVRDKRDLVFTVADSLAKWRYVDIGEQNDDYIEIKNGISEAEDVIVQGHYTLAHDAKVEVVN